MSEPESRHLEPAEIVQAAAETPSDPSVASHLEACEACKGKVKDWRTDAAVFQVLRAKQPLGLTAGCPTIGDLAGYCAKGKEPDAEVLDHLSRCDRCAAIVRDVFDLEVPHATPMLQSSTGAWQREMAARFAQQSRKRVRPWLLYAGAAAAVIFAAGAALWWVQFRSSEPADLLAAAYTELRPFDYRLPDRGYGPVRQQRGVVSAAFDRSRALISAETEIRRRLESHAADPSILALKGRAQLVENDYEGAIESLTEASESKPDDPELLNELGVAYAMRAGAEKNRNIDNGRALDLFARASGKQPSNERYLFNLALVCENLWLVEESLDTWNRLLKLKLDPGWRREAEDHRSRMEKILEERKKAEDSLLKDPASFVARFNKSRDFDPEAYQDIFWADWVPRIHSSSAAAAAAILEANAFRDRFHDPYLTDILSGIRSASESPAISDLVQTVAVNKSGQTDRAAETALKAAPELKAAGIPAGELRAEVELSYDYKRQAKQRECLATSENVIREASLRSYAWLAGQAHLEHAACVEQISQSGAARTEVEQALTSLDRAGLKVLALRARGYVTGMDRISGNYAPIWEDGPAGLQTYWNILASPLRAQDFQFNMQWSARAMGWEKAAVVLDGASVRSLARVGNPEMEALNRVYLASLLKEDRQYDEAANEFRRAERLFQFISPGPTLQNLNWQARLTRSEVEVATGRSRDAIQELDALTVDAASRTSVQEMQVHQVRGLALLATGDWRGAMESFKKSVEWNQRTAASVSSFLERIPILESAAPSYRNLAELQLIQLHDPKASLTTFLLYQGAAAEPVGGDNKLVVVYGVLPSKTVVWSVKGTAVDARIVDAPPAEIERVCRRFLRLCSLPKSSQAEIRDLGNRLYRWLLEPELRSDPSQVVYLRTDSSLALIPFAALVTNDHRYVGLDRTFVHLVGPSAREPQEPETISAAIPALIVSVPGGEAPGERPLPFLQSAEQEAEEVSAHFAQPIFLKDGSATADAIAAQSGQSKLFHFCGHGWVNGGDGGLILSPAADGSPRFETFREIAKQNWKQCSLAVLSACLTAAGEERGAIDNQSLVSAMLGAGARRVIAARWSVDSEGTRALMSRFYARLLSGAYASTALFEAAREISRSSPWNHPYYWAGFDTFSSTREP